MTIAFVGLGSNLGNPHRQLMRAKLLLQALPGSRLVAFSPLYASEPVGCMGKQPPFINAAAMMQTSLAPERFHFQLQQIEKQVQKRKRISKAPRWLDLDYLLHGHVKKCSFKLKLPHPQCYQRAFVLYPLNDIVPPSPLKKRIQKALLSCQNQKLFRL